MFISAGDHDNSSIREGKRSARDSFANKHNAKKGRYIEALDDADNGETASTAKKRTVSESSDDENYGTTSPASKKRKANADENDDSRGGKRSSIIENCVIC